MKTENQAFFRCISRNEKNCRKGCVLTHKYGVQNKHGETYPFSCPFRIGSDKETMKQISRDEFMRSYQFENKKQEV